MALLRISDLGWRPNTRMQRTRSSPSALRSPLMRCPLGSAKLLRALLLQCVPLAALSCSASTASPANLSGWCSGGSAVDFGVQRLHGLVGVLKGEQGPVPNAAVRWRAVGSSMTATADWAAGATDQDGRFFVTDMSSGRWQLEICAKGYRPIQGIVEISEGSPIDSFELVAERDNGQH